MTLLHMFGECWVVVVVSCAGDKHDVGTAGVSSRSHWALHCLKWLLQILARGLPYGEHTRGSSSSYGMQLCGV